MGTIRKFERLLYAHRGANFLYPENSLEAFKEAVKLGVNALELDVHITKDNVVVVFHDADGLRMAGEKAKIKDCSFLEIQKWRLGEKRNYKIPTFQEIIEQFPNLPLNVDIKDHDFEKVACVVETVRRNGAQARVRLTSEDSRIISKVKSLGYTGPLGMGLRDILAVYFLPKWKLRKKGLEGRAIQIPLRASFFNLASSRFINKCHELGIRVDYWVVNDQQTADHLYSLGADGVMTDDPAMVKLRHF